MAGKFANEADEFVHGLSLDGCEAEAGDVQFGRGWFGLVSFGNDEAAEVEAIAGLSFRPEGAIVNEDGQGFVSVDYFPDVPTLVEAWAEVEDEDYDPDA